MPFDYKKSPFTCKIMVKKRVTGSHSGVTSKAKKMKERVAPLWLGISKAGVFTLGRKMALLLLASM